MRTNPSPEHDPAKHLFAPEELAVLRVIGRGICSSKEIAKRLDMADERGYPNATLKVVLRLLIGRNVLENVNDGYRCTPFMVQLFEHIPILGDTPAPTQPPEAPR